MDDFGDLRVIRRYIREGTPEDVALLELEAHLIEFNRHYETGWSLTAPKRGVHKSAVIGKATDGNHNLYQIHIDAILNSCPMPLDTENIRKCLVAYGEKESTAKLLAPEYYRRIQAILRPLSRLNSKWDWENNTAVKK